MTNWYKEAIGYQIYPRSFKDSNNDGIGDLQGVISKLDYLKDLGVNMIWLCPVYDSPMDDNGYDVRNYYDIAKDYGSIDDMKQLIKEAHDRGIKVVMDLVLNHTSDEHEWFVESRKSVDNEYRDYYVWAKGKIKDGVEVEPTNWESFFKGSVWKKDETTDMYYMKIFSEKMPDLNWECEEMRHQMYKMVKWWIELGIDGFRVDAASHLDKAPLEDAEGDERYVADYSKFSNLSKVFDYLDELNEQVLKHYDVMTVGEIGGGADLEAILNYAGSDKNRFSMAFTFDHVYHNGLYDCLNNGFDLKLNLVSLKKSLARLQTELHGKAWQPLYWYNHDHPRLVSQYGSMEYHNESCKMLATALYFSSGTPFIYNGEEIGMTNGDFKSISDFRDVNTINVYHDNLSRGYDESDCLKYIQVTAKDNARTPIQWDKSENAGFSNVEPWIKVNDNYKNINVEDQLNDPNSVLNFYKKLITLRKSDEYKNTILYGNYQLLKEEDPNVYTYLRSGEKKLLIVCNFFESEKEVSFDYKVKNIVLSNYENVSSDLNSLKLRPFESIVFELE